MRIEDVDNIKDIDEETPLTVLLIDSRTCETKSCEPVIVNGVKFGYFLDETLKIMGNDYVEDGNIYTFKDIETGVESCKFVFQKDTLTTVVFNFK